MSKDLSRELEDFLRNFSNNTNLEFNCRKERREYVIRVTEGTFLITEKRVSENVVLEGIECNGYELKHIAHIIIRPGAK